MNRSRRVRLFAAVVALLGVLAAQLALAAYACPGVGTSVATTAPQGGAHPCCDEGGVPVGDAALCNAHCQQGHQSLDKPATPSLAMVALPAWLPGFAAGAGGIASVPLEQPSLLARPTAPPVALRHCCLRI